MAERFQLQQSYDQYLPDQNQLKRRFDNRKFHTKQYPGNLVSSYCNDIHLKANTISAYELKKSLDELLYEIKHFKNEEKIYNLNYILSTLIHVNPLELIKIIEHEFFIYLQSSLVEIIQRWQSDVHLNENDMLLFRSISKLLKILFKNVNSVDSYPTWLFDRSLKKIVSICLINVSQSNKYLHEKHKLQIKIIAQILDIYIDYQKNSKDENSLKKDLFADLIDSVIACLTSNQYISSFYKIEFNKKSMETAEKFFLIKCPSFLASYNGSRLEEVTNHLVSTMITKYTILFDELIPSLSEWKRPITRAVYHLIKIINHGLTNTEIFLNHLSFIDHILKIIDTPRFYNELRDTLSNIETNLIDTAVYFLVKIIKTPKLIQYIEEKQMTPTFLRLTSAKYENIANNIHTLLALTIREKDIDAMNTPGNLITKVMTSLKDSVEQNPNDSEQTSSLLRTLKDYAQHDQMKNEILEKDDLPFVFECVNKFTGQSLTLLLEFLWSLSFSPEISQALRRNPQFLEDIQMISKNTDDEALKKASGGLEWKLIREPQIIKKTEEDQTDNKTTTTNVAQTERTFLYDMMISYCHADKEIVYKIHQFLQSVGFKIWIDLENMFGPAMEAMADAVENSEFIIMCMSDSYKKSTYCQAEAEYGFNRKRRLLPLIVRPKYRPDGWLGFMIGSRIYIDFGTFHFDEACRRLIQEIKLQLKRSLPSTLNKITQPENSVETTSIVKTECGDTPITANTVPDYNLIKKPPIVTEKRPIVQWTQSDVLDFLRYYHLNEIISLCENIDGLALVKLYNMCSADSNQMYRLLNDEVLSERKSKLPIAVYAKFLSLMEPLVQSLLPPSVVKAEPQPQVIVVPSPVVFYRSPVQDSGLPYDVLVTSNASASEVLHMVKRSIPNIESVQLNRPRHIVDYGTTSSIS